MPRLDSELSSADAVAGAPWLTAAGAYLELAKPRLTVLAVTATLVGYFLGADVLHVRELLAVLLGAFLIGSGANAINQYLERDLDARMQRTAGRPIPTGRLPAGEALVFGALLASVGVVFFFHTTNLRTALLALGIVLSYLFVYTPLKRITPLNTLVGAVPGALPVLMGWSATGASLTVGAWSLFAILFVWQIPHFFAIAWVHQDDYRRAGFPMLPTRDATGHATAFHVLWTSLLMVVLTCLPSLTGVAKPHYMFGAALAGAVYLVFVARFAVLRSKSAARGVFYASIVYLPVLMIWMMFTKIG